MNQMTKRRPVAAISELIARVHAMEDHSNHTQITLPTGEIPACWIKTLNDNNIPLRVKVVSDRNPDLTKDQIYNVAEYDVHREGQNHPVVITGEFADNQSLRTTFELGAGEVDPILELDVEHVATTVRELLIEKRRKELDELKARLADYDKPAERPLQKGDFVRWKPHLFAGGGNRNDALYQIVDAGAGVNEECLMLKAKVFSSTGLWEGFDCIIAGVDRDGDLMFYPANSRRLELADLSDL